MICHAANACTKILERMMKMKKSREQMRRNVMQRIPNVVQQTVMVAIERQPAMVCDLDKIVRTHSCRPERAAELMEHVVALVASEQPGADRAYLRQQAFQAAAIDDGKKEVIQAKIVEVELLKKGWQIRYDGSWSLWIQSIPDGYTPKVGSDLCSFANGCFVLGVVIDGHVCRYKTCEQERREQQAALERRREETRKQFSEHDAAIEKLPDVFQRRIKKFQRAPLFREDLEAYEIFVCEQAVLFAEKLQTIDELIRWSELDFGQRREVVPEISDGHSGNTFGLACCLARLYLEQPEMIMEMPGAMAPLVGSNAYLPVEERSA